MPCSLLSSNLRWHYWELSWKTISRNVPRNGPIISQSYSREEYLNLTLANQVSKIHRDILVNRGNISWRWRVTKMLFYVLSKTTMNRTCEERDCFMENANKKLTVLRTRNRQLTIIYKISLQLTRENMNRWLGATRMWLNKWILTITWTCK